MVESQALVTNEFNKKLLLIINPVSGKKIILRHIPDIIRIFMDAGYLVSTMVTGKAGDASEFSCRYGKDYDLVCCTGGDGTLNETINGLVESNTHVPLSYIPCGSTNDFANSHCLSTDILKAAENAARGTVIDYDIGRFGQHYFTYLAAFGAFSWLAYTTDQNKKNLLGHTAYVLDGIKDLSKIKPIHLKMEADGVMHEDDYIFGAVCNSPSIVGAITLPLQSVDTCDGIFEVLLIKMPKNLSELDNIIRCILTIDYTSPQLDFFHARDIVVENPPGLVWALDGEASGYYEKVHINPVNSFLHLKA